MRMRHLVIMGGLLAGCAPSNTWKDPTVGQVELKKVLAVCACRDSLRRAVEDRLAGAIQGAEPSYRFLADERIEDEAAARATVEEGNFDGVVVLRVVIEDKYPTYDPGQAYIAPVEYRSLWRRWGPGRVIYGTPYDPAHVQEGQLVNFDTNVYSVADERLVWASRRQTRHTRSAPKMVGDVIAETAKEMRAAKVVK
jgi:hypothetical protein